MIPKVPKENQQVPRNLVVHVLLELFDTQPETLDSKVEIKRSDGGWSCRGTRVPTKGYVIRLKCG